MTNQSANARLAEAQAIELSAPQAAENLYVEVLRAEPGNLEAHHALERLQSEDRYSKWMRVNCNIHPQDDIFKFISSQAVSTNPIREYLSDGWRTLSELMLLLESVDRPLVKMNAVLEFAAGFGRFTRHLSRVLPGKVTSSDVLPGTADFLQEQFGVNAFYSSHQPEKLALKPEFDMVFVLSLFTHLPPAAWRVWLEALAAGVRTSGVLVITTHSESCAKDQGVAFQGDGTFFVASSESPSIDGEVYGTTFTTRRFAEDMISSVPGLRVLRYQDNAFWVGQDAIVVEVSRP
jgi:Methyltransferase domain